MARTARPVRAKRQPLTADQRREVNELLTRTRAFVGRFMLKLTPTDAVVEVDPAVAQARGAVDVGGQVGQ